MLKHARAVRSDEVDTWEPEAPLIFAYRSNAALRQDLMGTQFWRDEILLESAKQAFRRRSVAPLGDVDFETEDRGLRYVEFEDYTEPDDDIEW